MGLLNWFAALSAGRGGRRAEIPPGQRVYAIGDIHGRADLLDELQEAIAEDIVRNAGRAPKGLRTTVVYLGDYVDRGQGSREVLDLLLAPGRLAGFQTVHLKGNHEDIFLRSLEDASLLARWFALGGDATALSYGVHLPSGLPEAQRYEHIRQQLLRRVPAPHLRFLRGLELYRVIGDYLFVHAGLRPGVPLGEQDPTDLLWIRGAFLKARRPFEKIVVHGHSLTGRPEVRPIRVGIDTGAYATNVLTCVVLEGSERAFLSTRKDRHEATRG
jgi:serine/threonine protein phosphatase 1